MCFFLWFHLSFLGSLLSSLGAVVLWLFVSLSCFLCFCVSPLYSRVPFPCFCLFWPFTGPGCQCSCSSSRPFSLFCFLYPSGVVPGLSGRRLVRISSATLISFPSSGTFLIPVLIALRNISFSVVPLAADWSGVSLCWPLSFTIPPFETKHCLWPQTGPGLCFSPHIHGTPHKTASRADHGLNLTLMRSSMTYWKHWAYIKIFLLSMA